METNNAIFFHNIDGDYGYMSNLYPILFHDSDNIYQSSEHYFIYKMCQMLDSSNDALLNAILSEKSPAMVKKYSKIFDFATCELTHQYDIMVDGLRLKFSDPTLAIKLLNTSKILYNYTKDLIWGIDLNVDRSVFGQNLLGKALMQVRDELMFEIDFN